MASTPSMKWKIMSDPLKLVIFDCDGTLVDSQDMIISAMNVACDKNGLEHPSAETVRRVVGLSLFTAIQTVMPDKDDAFIENVVGDYRDAFVHLRETEHHEPLYPGTVAALDALHAEGYLLGIATGKSGRGLRNTLAVHQLEKYFVTIQTADGNASKPNPEMLQKAMKEAGVDAKDTIMIGDTSFDMLMSGNADVTAIGVSWGYHPENELIEAGAKTVIHHYDELLPLVKSIFNEPI